MNTTAPSRPEYQPPALRIIPVIPESVVCGSPIPGGIEDIGYDEWE